MTQTKLNKVAPSGNATLLNANLRLLAPKLVSYECEINSLILGITADPQCAAAIIRYANKRNNDPDTRIDSIKHAAVYLGLIECKHFLFTYLLLNPDIAERAKVVQLLVRAKLTSALFKTNGPVNKDLAFVATLLTHKRFLKIQKPETLYMLFKLANDKKDAVRNLDFGLRNTIKQAVIIETKCNPKSPKREAMPQEFETMFQDAVYWANGLLSSIS